MKIKVTGLMVAVFLLSPFSAFALNDAAMACGSAASASGLEKEFATTLALSKKLLNNKSLEIISTKLSENEANATNCADLVAANLALLKAVNQSLLKLEADLTLN